jgi:hypothetical protein
MCTVTFIPRRKGYCLGMNRDEKLTRAKGLGPAIRIINGRRVLCPSEPHGGTWIALNDKGVSFALVNWYSAAAKANGDTVSRGTIIPSLSEAESSALANTSLSALPLDRINPFRLIGVFPVSREITEWGWDLKLLTRKQNRWRAQQWISSGFDEPTAQRVRGKTLRHMQDQRSARTIGWLRRLHRSHSPTVGPFSICMHREDASTVSYTEIYVQSACGVMRHVCGPPCRSASSHFHVGHRRLPENPSLAIPLKARGRHVGRPEKPPGISMPENDKLVTRSIELRGPLSHS